MSERATHEGDLVVGPNRRVNIEDLEIRGRLIVQGDSDVLVRNCVIRGYV